MSGYRVTARRTGDWWALEVPELPGVFTQAKRLDQAETVASEAIAVMLDVAPGDVRVEVEPVLSRDAREALAHLAAARAAAADAVVGEKSAALEAAAVLTRELSQRDAGRLLGVSFQRVSQLLKERAAQTAQEHGVLPARRRSGSGPGHEPGGGRAAA
ncbi:hypothetical protein JJV70_04360 [Streptomyces sp. JJ66]|uniref:type II toxin-antitoxin system HicB family antitoxin n=1 Tax=Streptomyces sp. JJ66 TaxID=2803843 RepID=UPI001C5851B8|nr:type II toxin-antitoxin system HicB family antitoxin [Streptomyces sp. JJ66]MBW1601348.1 hypothetical protein [Streptomyces sp. JJ66]